jgi:hypothetical protein
LLACSKAPPAATESKSEAPPPAGCERLPFAEATTVPEASGAAWMTIDGALVLVVIGDSGNKGAFGFVDPETGATTLRGTLPLGDGASDDLEGVAARGDRLFAITSSGYVREWTWQAGAFVLVAGPYPIGGGDLVCKATKTNCGNNYEGLALARTTAAGCDGYACSKAEGAVYCLTEQDGKLTATGAKQKVVSRGDILADCAFPADDDTTLYIGNNLFGLSSVARVKGSEITDLGALGTGFPETIAVRGDIIYRMSDTGGKGPSLMFKFRCPVAGR